MFFCPKRSLNPFIISSFLLLVFTTLSKILCKTSCAPTLIWPKFSATDLFITIVFPEAKPPILLKLSIASFFLSSDIFKEFTDSSNFFWFSWAVSSSMTSSFVFNSSPSLNLKSSAKTKVFSTCFSVKSSNLDWKKASLLVTFLTIKASSSSIAGWSKTLFFFWAKSSVISPVSLMFSIFSELLYVLKTSSAIFLFYCCLTWLYFSKVLVYRS